MLHRIPGLIFVILGLASLADAWRITSTVRDTATFDALGPDRYLMLASVLMVISGALLALIPPNRRPTLPRRRQRPLVPVDCRLMS